MLGDCRLTDVERFDELVHRPLVLRQQLEDQPSVRLRPTSPPSFCRVSLANTQY